MAEYVGNDKLVISCASEGRTIEYTLDEFEALSSEALGELESVDVRVSTKDYDTVAMLRLSRHGGAALTLSGSDRVKVTGTLDALQKRFEAGKSRVPGRLELIIGPSWLLLLAGGLDAAISSSTAGYVISGVVGGLGVAGLGGSVIAGSMVPRLQLRASNDKSSFRTVRVGRGVLSILRLLPAAIVGALVDRLFR